MIRNFLYWFYRECPAYISLPLILLVPILLVVFLA